MANCELVFLLVFTCIVYFSAAVPEAGTKEMSFNEGLLYHGFHKSLFSGAKIYISGVCSNVSKTRLLRVEWTLYFSDCAQAFARLPNDKLSDIPESLELDSAVEFLTDNGPFYLQLNKKTSKAQKQKTTKKNKMSKNAKKTPKTPGTSTENANEKKELKTVEQNIPPKKHGAKDVKKVLKTVEQNIPQKKHGAKDVKKVLKTVEQNIPQKKHGAKDVKTPVTRRTSSGKPTKIRRSKAKRQRKLDTHAPGRHKRAVPEEKENTSETTKGNKSKSTTIGKVNKSSKRIQSGQNGIVTAVEKDGNYLLRVYVSSPRDLAYKVEITVKIKSDPYGFLSAAEWPLLPFYGVMSLVYLAYGVVWLIVSACQWRELLRIQFWIGGVIALGMLEKAVLFSEYNNINNTGVPAHGLVVFSLVISCIKRTLSRILIIIVSLGFGIVKPRLGAALHRVLAVGFLYFILSVIEGGYREKSLKADAENKQLVAAIPLSILDAVICWWIFMSLMQTMRTLRIRKNIVKLSLYRHFTNILVFSVIASVAFMIWSIKSYHLNSCIKDWKELWIDEAFWHFLFAIVLLAIMVLWRPTANNQRYAFTPLIDVGEDDDDDMTLSDAFNGMKMRNKSEDVSSRGEKNRNKLEDDLKWVEENIPTAGGIDTALPTLLDSDEEVMTTKLEMSKME